MFNISSISGGLFAPLKGKSFHTLCVCIPSSITYLLYMHRSGVCKLTGDATFMSLRSFTDPGLDYDDFLIDILCWSW